MPISKAFQAVEALPPEIQAAPRYVTGLKPETPLPGPGVLQKCRSPRKKKLSQKWRKITPDTRVFRKGRLCEGRFFA